MRTTPLVALALLCLSPGVLAEPNPLSHTVNVTCESFGVKVLVNEVPIVERAGGLVSSSQRVGQWLLAGNNKITVELVAPAGKPGKKRFHLTYRADPPGRISDAPPVLSDEWKEAAMPKALPFRKDYPIKIAAPPPSRFLATAKPLRLDGETRKQAETVLKSLHAALVARDKGKLVAMFRFSQKDVSPAMGWGEATDKEIESFAESIHSAKAWRIAPLEPKKLAFKLVCGATMVMISRVDGKQVIDASLAPDSPIGTDRVCVAPVDGRWTLVRYQ